MQLNPLDSSVQLNPLADAVAQANEHRPSNDDDATPGGPASSSYVFSSTVLRTLTKFAPMQFSDQHERKATWFDLFTDLLVVAFMNKLSLVFVTGVQHKRAFEAIHVLFILLSPVYWHWYYLQEYLNLFDSQDLYHCVLHFVTAALYALWSLSGLNCAQALTSFDVSRALRESGDEHVEHASAWKKHTHDVKSHVVHSGGGTVHVDNHEDAPSCVAFVSVNSAAFGVLALIFVRAYFSSVMRLERNRQARASVGLVLVQHTLTSIAWLGLASLSNEVGTTSVLMTLWWCVVVASAIGLYAIARGSLSVQSIRAQMETDSPARRPSCAVTRAALGALPTVQMSVKQTSLLNAELMSERQGLFYLLALGEGVVASVHTQLSSQPFESEDETMHFFSSLIGIINFFLFKLLYFDIEPDDDSRFTHALSRKSLACGLFWVVLHLPLCVSAVALGGCVESIAHNIHLSDRSAEVNLVADGVCMSMLITIMCIFSLKVLKRPNMSSGCVRLRQIRMTVTIVGAAGALMGLTFFRNAVFEQLLLSTLTLVAVIVGNVYGIHIEERLAREAAPLASHA